MALRHRRMVVGSISSIQIDEMCPAAARSALPNIPDSAMRFRIFFGREWRDLIVIVTVHFAPGRTRGRSSR